MSRILLEAHAHTSEVSRCSRLPAARLVESVHAAGYGALIVTDHYLPGERNTRQAREEFLTGFRAARDAAGQYGDMTVLPGMEIRFKGHDEDFLVYGLDEEDILDLPDDVCEAPAALHEFHEYCKAHGFLIYQAHPYRPGLFPANTPDIDGVETFNGNPRHDSRNRMAALFASRHNLHTIAGGDVHEEGDQGTVGLLVPDTALTPKAFAEWLRATPHPRLQYQEEPRDGIRYLCGAIPSRKMLTALYNDAGWTAYTDDIDKTIRAIKGSARIVTAWDDTALVGLGRAITDGESIVYVQDLLVLGAYRRRGIGSALLQRLLAPYSSVRMTCLATDDTRDTRAFYRACGFTAAEDYGCVSFMKLKN